MMPTTLDPRQKKGCAWSRDRSTSQFATGFRTFSSNSRVPPCTPGDRQQPINTNKKRNYEDTPDYVLLLPAEGDTLTRRQHRPANSPATCHPERVDLTGPNRVLMV